MAAFLVLLSVALKVMLRLAELAVGLSLLLFSKVTARSMLW